MESTVLTLLAGLAAGATHVLAGPDHLVAVAPIVADRPGRAGLSGLLWGGGHMLGVLTVAALALLLRSLLPLDAISSWSERLVGVAMVGIGLWGLRGTLGRRLHVHRHVHDGFEHVHLHLHTHAPDAAHEAPVAHAHAHLSVAMGILHGLAGSAHVLGVLPALALPALTDAAVFLLAFGAGGIAAMTAYGVLLGRLAHRLAPPVHRWALTGASLGAIALGAVWLMA